MNSNQLSMHRNEFNRIFSIEFEYVKPSLELCHFYIQNTYHFPKQRSLITHSILRLTMLLNTIRKIASVFILLKYFAYRERHYSILWILNKTTASIVEDNRAIMLSCTPRWKGWRTLKGYINISGPSLFSLIS